jgi:uncharacterized protein YcfJ
MTSIRNCAIGATLVVIGAQAIAQAPPATTPPATPPPSTPLSTSLGMVVFPAKGQTAQQQSQDEGECYAWSKGQTGVDPMAPPPAAAQPAQPAQASSGADGSRVRSAARGAAAGAVIGEIADDDAGKGAAIGATAGVLAGGRQSRKNKEAAAQQATQAQEQATQQQQAAQQQQTDLFKKGFAACLEPKGYTVK